MSSSGQCLPDEIQGTLHLTVPEAPADVLDRISQPRLVRALARRVSGPSLGRLRHVLDAHGAMKPVQYVAGGRHRSLIAGWAVKPSVQRLSGDECPCRVMVLSAVGVSRRMMVSEAPAS